MGQEGPVNPWGLKKISIKTQWEKGGDSMSTVTWIELSLSNSELGPGT